MFVVMTALLFNELFEHYVHSARPKMDHGRFEAVEKSHKW